MKKNLAFILFGIAMIAVQSTWAEDKIADVTDMQALRSAVRADKKALVASTLKLTAAEAKKFWPLYDAYQRDLDLANRRRNVALEGLIGLDKPLSDLYARNLANELLAADEAEIKARRSLHNRLMRGCRRGSLLRQTRRAICSSKTRSAPCRPTTSLRPFR